MEEALERVTRESASLRASRDSAETDAKRIIKELKEKQLLISQLEHVGSAQRDDVLRAREELARTRQALDLLRQDKSQADGSAEAVAARVASSEAEVRLYCADCDSFLRSI